MAKLVKLQLSGIRSFGPFEDQSQQLKFSSPVTLILGQNGCGKTTIIEALKYVCSGELPGGTNSGQGFINDPKMTGKISTKGQIKLKITDAKGDEVTICRIMEVVQTSASLKFKSVSSTVRRVGPNGDKSISGRCADITSECCQIMNVSPAVLNNVIFCHQENSAWPLDEGQKLKEKFDEIFDAQKYNKCTEAFRKEAKEMQLKVKLLKNDLGHKKDKKEFVDRQQRALQRKEEQLQTYENDIRTKNEQLEPLRKRLDEILELEMALTGLEKQLTSKEATKRGVIEEQNTIKRNLPFEFEGTDAELQDKIKSFSKEREKHENFISELEKRKTEIENRIKHVTAAIRDAQTELGKMNHEKSQHSNKISERKKLLEGAGTQMDLHLSGDFEDHGAAKNAIGQVKLAVDSSMKQLEKMIEENESEESNLQKVIDEARGNSLRTKHNIDSKEKQLREYEQSVAQIESELSNLATSDEYLKDCQTKIASIDRTIFNLSDSFKDTEESQRTEDYKTDIQNMERSLEKLESDHKLLQQNDVIEGKLESEKRLILEKQREVHRIRNKHLESLKKLFGNNLPEKNMRDAVLSMQTTADSSVKSLTEKIAKKQKEVTTLDVRRGHQAEKIANCEKELKTKKQQLFDVCRGRDFNESLNESFEKKKKLQHDKGQYSSAEVFFNKYVREFKKDAPCCPICETDFKDRNEAVKTIIAKLEGKLELIPGKLAAVEKELEREEATFNKLQQLKLVNGEVEVIEKETLRGLRQELERIDDGLLSSKSELEEFKMQLERPQCVVDISKTLIGDMAFLDQNQADVDKSKRMVETLQRELVQVDSNKSKQEVEAEMDFIKSEISELRRKVDAQVKKINNHKDRLQQLNQERITLVERKMRLQEGIQSKPVLEKQKTELEEKKVVLNDQIFDLRASLSLVEEELKGAIKNKDKVTGKNKLTVQKEREKISGYNKTFQDLEKLQQEIEQYVRNRTEEKLASIEEKLKDWKNKDDTLDQTKSKILAAISEKKEEIAKQQLNFTTLQNNAVLREKKGQEKGLEVEIQELKRKIGGYNYRTVNEEKRRLCLEQANVEKQINNLEGEKTGLQSAINELRQELALPENRQAYTNYMSKFYELKIAECALKDINNYVSALEKAVLDFHKAKMTQINKNIRELWRDTYRGNDIDYIEIKTEHGTGTSRKRSYNYKVVQIKKGVELDMRGRCSAGQKVLACLMIRMALAETLSANCGILALDEPTTNLDRDNIKSLSDTLSRIVNARQAERNFQLLIITHDEEFLNMLTRVQGVSFFHRVMRDVEGFSVINKEYAL